jgi:DNA-binding transcriptional LysR family regulator
MDLNEIAIFIKVVQTGSFTQAARELSLPNSTVSHKIANLEKRLGITLIQRTTRKLNITPAGQAYFNRCLAGLTEIKAAEVEAASQQGEPKGLLKITAPLDLGSSFLPAVISKYMKKYPKVTVEVILTDRRMDLLSEGIDVAIRAGELKDSTLKAKKIGSTYFILVAGPGYLNLKGYPENPRELIAHDCLHFTSLGNESWKLFGAKGPVTIQPGRKTLINHLEMIKVMAMMDNGIAYLPNHFVSAEIKARKLVRVLPGWRSSASPVHLVYPSQQFMTTKLSSFLDYAGNDLKDKLQKFERIM